VQEKQPTGSTKATSSGGKYMVKDNSGVDVEEFKSYDIPVNKVCILAEEAAKFLNKPCGTYITITTGPLDELAPLENLCSCLVEQLKPLLELYFGKTVCICGIGNRNIDADSLGPETAKRIWPYMYEKFKIESNFSKLAVICPDV